MSQSITSTIASLRALLAAATPGPWAPVIGTRKTGEPFLQAVTSAKPASPDAQWEADVLDTEGGNTGPSLADAQLLCAAVNALPLLLALAEAAEAWEVSRDDTTAEHGGSERALREARGDAELELRRALEALRTPPPQEGE